MTGVIRHVSGRVAIPPRQRIVRGKLRQSANMCAALARQVPLSQARQHSDHSSICLLIYATQNGWKLPIMCEELGIKYDWALVDFSKNEQKSPDFLEINPNGRIPALIDKEADVTVAESSVILEYLATKFKSKLLPSSLQQNLHVRQWLAWQVSGLGPMMGQAMAFQVSTTDLQGGHDYHANLDVHAHVNLELHCRRTHAEGRATPHSHQLPLHGWHS